MMKWDTRGNTMKTTTEVAQTNAPLTSTNVLPTAGEDRSPKGRRRKSAALKVTNILVPIDFSTTSHQALEYAVPIASQFEAKITLVHAVETFSLAPGMTYVPVDGRLLTAPIERNLQRLARRTIEPELLRDLLVRAGTPFEVITNVARELEIDLIVMTTHGYTGVQHLFQGSVTERVVREAPCPVLVVHPTEPEFV